MNELDILSHKSSGIKNTVVPISPVISAANYQTELKQIWADKLASKVSEVLI